MLALPWGQYEIPCLTIRFGFQLVIPIFEGDAAILLDDDQPEDGL